MKYELMIVGPVQCPARGSRQSSFIAFMRIGIYDAATEEIRVELGLVDNRRAGPAAAAGETPASCSPRLDAAAKALADGQFDAAAEGFEAVAKDTSAPAFVRGLALLGLAETATVRGDSAAATAAWQRLAADATRAAVLPRYGATLPRRGRASEDRACPAVIPLPTVCSCLPLPEPAVVFHVAPTGSDEADGSEAKPFRTLERARDAVRALKKSRGESPKGGVKIVIGRRRISRGDR